MSDVLDLLLAMEAAGIPPQDAPRIVRHAETVTTTDVPAALSHELDGRCRVGAYPAGSAGYFNGSFLGVWKGRELLAWTKREHWEPATLPPA